MTATATTTDTATAIDPALDARLRMLRDTMPSASGRRTARGVLRTCRELGDHLRRVERLLPQATTDAERTAVETLARDIEERRAALVNGRELGDQVRRQRAEQSQRRVAGRRGARGATRRCRQLTDLRILVERLLPPAK